MKKKNLSKKKNISPKNKKAKFDCTYNNGICNNRQSVFYGAQCKGNIKCKSYRFFWTNDVKVNFIIENYKVRVDVSISDIKISDFDKVSSNHILHFRGITNFGIIVVAQFIFYNYESYIRFILNENEFNLNVKRYKNSISISIENPSEIQRIMDLAYKNIPDRITINKHIKNDDVNIQIRVIIPKKIFFDKISRLSKNIVTDMSASAKNNSSNKPVEIYSDNMLQQQSILKGFNKDSRNVMKKVEVGVEAIVLSDNRKCIYSNHELTDIVAILRIAIPSGKVIDYSIPAAYCKECDAYFVLKQDFNKAKLRGIILCPVIDKDVYNTRKKYNIKSTGGESKIHELGYNVRKGNNYTTEQRHIVLANILENTNISMHEIQSNISRCIKQHQKQMNYAEAVRCWINDYDFLTTYKSGDIPQVIIKQIKIGR